MARENVRRWFVPNKRAKNYAEERKAKVHQRGQKEGKELTDYEAGLRSGYLQCQSDHAGMIQIGYGCRLFKERSNKVFKRKRNKT